ncbi:MAG: NAD(P)H-binding protein [Micrococcales bacterium]|nr:NAD(P)H-binding protein [Micrococcales bacterium]
MVDVSDAPTPIVVVTGANGLVGSRVCEKLVAAGASVRAVVRRKGSAPQLAGVEEVVGDFGDAEFARFVVQGVTAVVTTVHPMGSDEQTQRRVAVQGTPVIARAAHDAGVTRLVHLSTAAVYDRSPTTGDVDELSQLVSDDTDDVYAITKRDTDAALAEVDGLTTILLRPPAILGSGESSVWNSLRPAAIREEEDARRAVPDKTRRPQLAGRRHRGGPRRDCRRSVRGTARRRLYRRQCDGAGWRDGARLSRDGLRGTRRGTGVAGGTSLDRSLPRRPSPRLGLDLDC